MEGNQNQKFTLAETVIASLFIGTIELAEAALVMIGLDDFGLLDLIAFPAITFYLYMKGVKLTFALIGNVVEVFPYLGWFPWRLTT